MAQAETLAESDPFAHMEPISIELTPLQARAFELVRARSEERMAEIARLQSQIKTIQGQIQKIAQDADTTYTGTLGQIAIEHGRESIPTQAELSVVDGVPRFSWREDMGQPPPQSSARKVLQRAKKRKAHNGTTRSVDVNGKRVPAARAKAAKKSKKKTAKA